MAAPFAYRSSSIATVKIEDHAEDGGAEADAGILRNADVDPLHGRVQSRVKEEEEGQPSSSSSYLRSQFIGMGFLSKLVDKVLQKHDDIDSDTILESLFLFCKVQESGSESSDFLGSLFDSDNEENSSPLESRKGINQDIKPELDSFLEKRSYLLRTMNFSQKEVDLAFNKQGEEAPLEQLVDCIVIAQLGGSSGGIENGDATNENSPVDLRLSHEVSSAIDSFGQGAKVEELADSILARRIANSIEQKEVKVEPDFLDETETEYTIYQLSYSAMNCYDDDNGRDNTRVKRAKHIFIDDRGASSSHSSNPWFMGRCAGINDIPVKEELQVMIPGCRANVHGDLTRPPYFFNGNVVEIPKDTWRQLSQFLYNVEPEFVNSHFFSALMRKEGYIHNLPTERRHAVKSPMTIEEALPFTKQWWPSWDTRKHIHVVTTEVVGIVQTCERLGRMIKESRGVLSQDKQMHIMHQCKTSNIIWVGKDKLSPLEPRQVERILGYPHNHTNLFELNPPDRLASLKFTFQTDTLAYLLSVLKHKYPDGMRVLSIYSGIGGAEVTLHRLGISLKCVVSVEESDVNRKILRRWLTKTEQTGELRQLHGIWKLKTHVIEDLIREFGGFDLIIGGNYSSCKGGMTINTTMGMDSKLFYEYARVVKRVRTTVGVH
ncbi:probable inactive DNA (cytosine-5)-methyltransferase DRM3 [Phragmites australis]|uniref:probable inactive DNA (cytosine-5)-methyltransferase DRM3 n=1 Tax=Phragmites australis TaxID=29695 RepID=UPI002D783931|nr:probable inactive DNA (cytosine-5)-methyltransferase DRM3 [Phragmites australis]